MKDRRNDEESGFEHRLRTTPLQAAPPEWRSAILARAEEAATTNGAGSLGWLGEFLGIRMAWGGLAAAWVLILGLNWVGRYEMPAADPIEGSAFNIRAVIETRREIMSALLAGDEPGAVQANGVAVEPQSSMGCRNREGWS